MSRRKKRGTKYIFVTGGVVSSLGKGLTTTSIGRILEVVPPEALRYLVIRDRPMKRITFDPGIPLLKLVGLFVLSGGALSGRPRTAAFTWHLVEWTGRWGMLDVLLVAVLVAVVKLGQLMELSAGPGALAFTACVALNLAASASFDPHSLWDEDAP